jgi:hypothetical protein
MFILKIITCYAVVFVFLSSTLEISVFILVIILILEESFSWLHTAAY